MVELSQTTRWALFALHTSGLDPRQTSYFAFILKWVGLVSNFAVVFISGLQMIEYAGIETVAKIEQLPNSFLNFCKFICIAYFRKELLDVLSDIDHFWELNRYGEEHKVKLESFHRFSNIFYKGFVSMCFVTATLLSFKPYIVNERILPLPGYDICDLETSPCFQLHSSFQIYHIMCQILPSIMGFDGLFISFLTYVYVEIELIKYGFKNVMNRDTINEEYARNELRELINHHDFILSFVKKLRQLYLLVLFVQYWTSMGALIFSLFIMTRNGIPPDRDLLIKYGQYLATILVQSGFYCFGGDILMQQVLSVADEVFNSEWWSKKDPILRKSASFVICRAQRPERLRIGKMYDLNLETYINLLRHVVSIYTILDKLA